MLNELQKALEKLAIVDTLRETIGAALTEPQQVAISAKVAADNTAFVRFVNSDAGRAATRAFADAFTAQ